MRGVCESPARLAVACTLMLLLVARVHALPESKSKGICSSMEIRGSPDLLRNSLRGCRVIEGSLSIVLIEKANSTSYERISFPELREVTEYVLIYRMRGLRNLGDLFPNLIVIRGKQLYKDFAFVVFDNENLEALGLRYLTVVERGAVRIERNDRLCYVNTVDWTRINPNDAINNILRSNYDERFCGLCPNAQSRVKDIRDSTSQCPSDASGRLLCWDENHCQNVCPNACGNRGCLSNGTCCHPLCLGGCDGPTARNCYVCRNLSLGNGDDRICIDSCPARTYELTSRCVSEHECRTTTPPEHPPSGFPVLRQYAPSIPAYKIFNNSKCVYMCPSGTMEEGDVHNAICKPCSDTGGCLRECEGGKIDSVAAAEQYRGCTIIKSKLEIALRASGGNTLSVLESSLGEIREIRGGLQVTRSYPLVSLTFLKKLRKITCNECGKNNGQVVHILNNPNLELLWDWTSHGPIDISGGTLYIHLNPRLCYNQLLPLMNMTTHPRSNFTEIEVSRESNGNQASCLPEMLNLKVSELRDKAVVLRWNIYCPDDLRKLLGYSVYYIATETNVTLYEQRDACSDYWNVLDITKSETSRNTTLEQHNNNSENFVFKMCDNMQPLFYLLANLSPFTRYAVYVKTYTTLQDKKGAQSSIIYFRTLPDKPTKPQALSVEILSPHEVYISWLPPALANGTIVLYHVEIQANSYNRDRILAGRHGVMDVCNNPTALSNLIQVRADEGHEEEESASVSKNGTCACDDSSNLRTRFNLRAEEESDDSIKFENELQNLIYVKTQNRATKSKTESNTRVRRSVDKGLNRMFVKVTKNNPPLPDMKFYNTTDDEVKCSRIEPKACVVVDNKTEFVSSYYYNLDGRTRSLSVRRLRHFTWYTASVWACRSKHPEETSDEYVERWCSPRSFKTFLTMDKPNADIVTNVRASLIQVNKTQPEVNVSWTGPANPNGFVVAYNVHYSRVNDGTQAQHMCVPVDDYEASTHSRLLRNLSPGNYSIKVSLITMRGPGNASTEIFLKIPDRLADTTLEWVWGVVCGCLVMLLVLAGVIWYVKRGLLPPTEAHKLFASVNPEYVSTVYVPDEWEVPRGNIEFIRELGQGSFGMVYEGIAKSIEKGKPETRCAVKTVNEHATDRERIEFLKEASVMKAFDTFHVVRLLGVVSRGQPTLVVMELMECGDLKTYLRSHRPDEHAPARGNTPPSLQNILQMAIEIADGMAYLSAKKFVHRDLAARNCMVAGDLTVKVGDFGMTRDIYETDYYRKGTKGLLPVRWMSPESLKDGVFSSSSDVWSFGVVLWEMATLAMQPYQGLSNEQVLRYVVEGGVMERPEHCPDRLYELMRGCWAHRPLARPSFLHLVADLAPGAAPYFRHRSFFHSPQGQELYALQRSNAEEEQELPEVDVGAVATGSGSNLFGVSGRLASWVRELSSLRSRASDEAAAEALQPLAAPRALPNGALPP